MGIGRTGRFGRKGCSVTFAHDDRSKADVEEIMSVLGKPMKKINAKSEADLDQLEKVGPFFPLLSLFHKDCLKGRGRVELISG